MHCNTAYPTPKEDVSLGTIDYLVKSKISKKPDLIKIDVNGHEFEIVKSMKKTIRKCRPVIILEELTKIEKISNLDKHYFNSEIYKEGDIEAPLQIKQFIEGTSLMFLIRFKSHKVLTMGSMNFVERELEGIKPDILLAGVNMSRFNMYKYDERLIRVTNFPKIIIPTHWDNFRVPYGFDQSFGIEKKIKPFIEKVKEISPNSKVIIPEHLKSFKIN